MTGYVQCFSPIDGSLYVERPLSSLDEARSAARAARQAQGSWAARPLQERIGLVLAGVAEIGKTTDHMALELAHQMGRPVRYGGEFRGFDERAR